MGHWTRRHLLFALTVLIGVVAGVVYGWVINPMPYSNASPDTLRSDYKTDIVLMTAELYQIENDIVTALARLDFLGGQAPQEILAQAIDYAEQHHYDLEDIQLMQALASAIEYNQQWIN